MNNIKAVLPLDWLIATGQPVTEETVKAHQEAAKGLYENRERINESVLWMADLYHELTQQEPTKRTFGDWILTFEEWKQEKLQPDHIRAAWQKANDDKGGFPVGRPGALTNTAVAMKSRMLAKPAAVAIDSRAVEATKKMLDEKWDFKPVPRPANCPSPNIGRNAK